MRLILSRTSDTTRSHQLRRSCLLGVKCLLVPPDAHLEYTKHDMEGPCILSKSVTLNTKSNSDHNVNSSEDIVNRLPEPSDCLVEAFLRFGY